MILLIMCRYPIGVATRPIFYHNRELAPLRGMCGHLVKYKHFLYSFVSAQKLNKTVAKNKQ